MFSRTDILPNGHFDKWIFHQTDILLKGCLVEAILPNEHLAEAVSPKGCFENVMTFA